jgi:hypothetical protein
MVFLLFNEDYEKHENLKLSFDSLKLTFGYMPHLLVGGLLMWCLNICMLFSSK